MSYLASPSQAGKSDTPAERDILLSSLRVAAARAKLEQNILEDLNIGLRQKALTCAEVRARLNKEGIRLQSDGGTR